MSNSIGRDAVKLTFSKVVTSTIGILSAMLLSRFRSLEEYGTYSQLLIVINLATSLLMLGLPNSINYFLAKADTEEKKQHFLSAYYTLSTILSFLVGTVLVISTPLIIDYFQNELIKYFIYFLAVYPWTKIIMSGIDNIFVVYKKTTYLIRFRVLNSVLQLLIIIIVKIFNRSFQEYMILYVFVEGLFSIYAYIIAKKIAAKLYISFDIKLIKNILTFSIPIGLASVVGTLNIELDKLIIGGFLGTEKLAIYTNAAREMPVALISSSLNAVLLPNMVRLIKKNESLKAINLWGDTIKLSYFIICFLAAGLIAYAPEVINLMYSDKYLSGVTVFRIYNLILLFRCTYFGMILNSLGKTKFILYSSVLSLLINALLNYLFLKWFGFIGPAIASVIAIGSISYYQLSYSSRLLNVKLKQIFPWISLFKITLLNVVFLIIFVIIKKIVPLEIYIGEIIESILLGTLWGIIYFGSILKKMKSIWHRINE